MTLKYVDDEKMVVYMDDKSKSFYHPKCCNVRMKQQPAFIGNEVSTYQLKEDNFILAEVTERHPQYFECLKCGKIKYRKFFGVMFNIRFYRTKYSAGFYFTALTDDISKKITFERLLEILKEG